MCPIFTNPVDWLKALSNCVKTHLFKLKTSKISSALTAAVLSLGKKMIPRRGGGECTIETPAKREEASHCDKWWSLRLEHSLDGVPRGTALGPLAFIVFINDIDGCGDNLNTLLSKFADDTKLGQVGYDQQEAAALQSCLDNLEDWAEQWDISFIVAKCKGVIRLLLTPLVADHLQWQKWRTLGAM